MNTYSLGLFSIGAGIIFIVISLIYNRATWKWKAEPIKPLIYGLALMILAFAADIFLTGFASEILDVLQKKSDVFTPAAYALMHDSAQVFEKLTKLLEYVIIPLAVSLIVAAIIAKSDQDFSIQVRNADKAKEEIKQLKLQLAEMEEQLKERVMNDERGTRILKPADDIKQKVTQIKYRYRYFYEDHRDLVRLRAVDGIKEEK